MSTYYYVKSECKANLLLTFAQVLGPFFHCDDEELSKQVTGAYFSPNERFAICILSCDDDSKDSWKKELEATKTDDNADIVLKLIAGVDTGKTFIIDGFCGDEKFIRERIEEVISVTCGVRVENERILKGTFSSITIPHRKIPDEVFNHQLAMAKKCAAVLDIPTVKQIVALESPNKAQVNLAYALSLYTGFTQGRKHICIPALKDNKELQSILETLDSWYVKKYPEFYVRADHIGDRLNTSTFITWCFGNGACSLKHIIERYDDFSKAFTSMLVTEGFDANKHLKGVKELLPVLYDWR